VNVWVEAIQVSEWVGRLAVGEMMEELVARLLFVSQMFLVLDLEQLV